MKVLNTRLADEDIFRVLFDTIRLFGQNQSQRYLEIIRIGIDGIAEHPTRPASKAHDEIGPGVRSFHLQTSAGRRGGASHVIYYRISAHDDGRPELIVLRLLADRMEPVRRVRTALWEKRR